jgi:formyltetrahydrofolate deformylase
METAVLLVQSDDQKGIVARISDFIFRRDANIIKSDQYSTDPAGGRFFMRLEFYFDPAQMPKQKLEADFAVLGRQMNAQWAFHYSSVVPRMGILVSQSDHCLFDILYRWKSGELRVDIPYVIGSHEECRETCRQFGIPFQYVEMTKEKRLEGEMRILNVVRDTSDFLVLARFMFVLSPGFLAAYQKDIINIHHSFLPSFKGANPYRQAYERGVKVIGATAHYVTETLDEGPIIEQMVERVTHRDSVDDLKRRGRNLEKLALAKALQAHVEHRVIRHQNKTIVFE